MPSLLDLSAGVRSLSPQIGFLDTLWRFAAVYLVFLGLIPLLLLWRRAEGLRVAVAAGAGAVLAIAVSAVIGHLWYRPRPFVAGHFTPLIHHAADASFPSDHLAALGALLICVALISRRLGLVLALIAAAVAFARVYVGVHYVTDVAGGLAVGIVCGLIAWWVTALSGAALDDLDRLLIRWHLRPSALPAADSS